MVAKVDRSGFRDWVVQRITALIIGAYSIFILVYFWSNPALDYLQWHTFFHHLWVKIFTVITVLSILWHAWIGLWTVFTDYVKNRIVRFILNFIVMTLLIVYVVWMIEILWR